MKISERKQRLRARGTVPVSQETTQRKTVATASSRTRGNVSASSSGGKKAPAPRPRWQPSPTYQLIFGLAYMVFSPILILNTLALAHAPHSKYHPGTFEYLMPVVFFAFGLWWFYRGLRARRQRRLNGSASQSLTQAPMRKAAGETREVAPASSSKPGLLALFKRPAR